MNNQRKFPRIEFRQPISIAVGSDDSESHAEIENLTVEGIAFHSELSLEEGSAVLVMFPGSDELNQNETLSEVIRCHPVEGASASRFHVVAHFIEINDGYLMDALKLVHRNKEGSLFDQVGGSSTLDSVHRSLYGKLFAHPWLKELFKNSEQDAIVNLLNQFMEHVMGGGKTYEGKAPLSAHKHLYITPEISKLRRDLLAECLLEAGLADGLQEKWLRIDQAFEQSVVKADPKHCAPRFKGDEILIVPKP